MGLDRASCLPSPNMHMHLCSDTVVCPHPRPPDVHGCAFFNSHFFLPLIRFSLYTILAEYLVCRPEFTPGPHLICAKESLLYHAEQKHGVQ